MNFRFLWCFALLLLCMSVLYYRVTLCNVNSLRLGIVLWARAFDFKVLMTL